MSIQQALEYLVEGTDIFYDRRIVRVIERLVASGALKKPSELRASGLCTIMFSDRLPE